MPGSSRFDPDIWVVELEPGSTPVEDLLNLTPSCADRPERLAELAGLPALLAGRCGSEYGGGRLERRGQRCRLPAADLVRRGLPMAQMIALEEQPDRLGVAETAGDRAPRRSRRPAPRASSRISARRADRRNRDLPAIDCAWRKSMPSASASAVWKNAAHAGERGVAQPGVERRPRAASEFQPSSSPADLVGRRTHHRAQPAADRFGGGARLRLSVAAADPARRWRRWLRFHRSSWLFEVDDGGGRLG